MLDRVHELSFGNLLLKSSSYSSLTGKKVQGENLIKKAAFAKDLHMLTMG